jgi:hypothetical protein
MLDLVIEMQASLRELLGDAGRAVVARRIACYPRDR